MELAASRSPPSMRLPASRSPSVSSTLSAEAALENAVVQARTMHAAADYSLSAAVQELASKLAATEHSLLLEMERCTHAFSQDERGVACCPTSSCSSSLSLSLSHSLSSHSRARSLSTAECKCNH